MRENPAPEISSFQPQEPAITNETLTKPESRSKNGGINGLINATRTLKMPNYHNNKSGSSIRLQDSISEDNNDSSPISSLPGSPLLRHTQRHSGDGGGTNNTKHFIANVTSLVRKCKNGKFESRSEVAQECKENILNELKKNGHSTRENFESDPIINLNSDSLV